MSTALDGDARAEEQQNGRDRGQAEEEDDARGEGEMRADLVTNVQYPLIIQITTLIRVVRRKTNSTKYEEIVFQRPLNAAVTSDGLFVLLNGSAIPSVPFCCAVIWRHHLPCKVLRVEQPEIRKRFLA